VGQKLLGALLLFTLITVGCTLRLDTRSDYERELDRATIESINEISKQHDEYLKAVSVETRVDCGITSRSCTLTWNDPNKAVKMVKLEIKEGFYGETFYYETKEGFSGSVVYHIPWERRGMITASSSYLYGDDEWYSGDYSSLDIKVYSDDSKNTQRCTNICQDHGEIYINFWIEKDGELICNCSED
jgi:hypothetical protein